MSEQLQQGALEPDGRLLALVELLRRGEVFAVDCGKCYEIFFYPQGHAIPKICRLCAAPLPAEILTVQGFLLATRRSLALGIN